MTILSPSQQNAEDEFRNFLNDDTAREMVITGAAGTGKSFLLTYLDRVVKSELKARNLISGLHNPEFETYYTATTNKAVVVLNQFIGQSVQTIHSLLGLKTKNDYDTGRVKLVTTNKTHKFPNSLIFIDEASMVSKHLLKIIRAISTETTKIVYIGDQYQLAPVGEMTSPVFQNPKRVVHLTEIQRQVANSPIIQAAHDFKNILMGGVPPKVWPEPKGSVIYSVNGPEFQEAVEDHYDASCNPNGAKILAWSNQKVLDYNNFVRKLYTNEPHFVKGERVMTNKPILATNKTVVVKTDQIVTITGAQQGIRDGFDGYHFNLNDSQKSWFYPLDWAKARAYLKHYAKHQNWAEYFEIKDNYLDLRSLHALTCHKSQGSTYRKVFIDMDDIGRNKKWQEVARLMYVAISRASEEVYLYGKLPIRNWK